MRRSPLNGGANSRGPQGKRVGVGWLVFIAMPPAIVVCGLVALFVWQGAKGGVRGKWQQAPRTVISGETNGSGPTNAVPRTR